MYMCTMDKDNLNLNIELEHELHTSSVRPKKCCGNYSASMQWRALCVCILAAAAACFIWVIVCTAGACSHKNKCTMDCTAQEPWNYNTAGPRCWGSCYSTCAMGRKQSPINLDSTQAQQTNFSTPLKLNSYGSSRRGQLYNTGYTIKLEVDHKIYNISGLGLDGVYVTDEIHFHWGSNSVQGSEHTIDRSKYPMEMHILHYRAEFDSIPDARYHPNGLAVLAFMFEIREEDNPEYNVIVNNLKNITLPGDELFTEPFALSKLLPEDTMSFYRYEGSLTIPGCAENVVWTVFTDRVPISKSQMKVFQNSIYSESSGEQILNNNFRPVQPVNERIVYKGDMHVDIVQ